MPSFSYSILKFVLKIKGLKSIFSQDPIPYHKLRKDDRFEPRKKHSKKNSFRTFEIEQSVITEITPKASTTSKSLIFYCPGGAFVCGPSDLGWDSMTYLTASTGAKAWLINYPKAPEYQIETIADNIYKIYKKALEEHDSSNIILLGDSVGGNLIITLVQKLIQENLPLPVQLIPISPLADASMLNSEIPAIDRLDLMLGKVGVLSANKMCAGNLALTDPILSPLFGSVESFPPVHLFLAGHDIFTPDINLLAKKMKVANVEVEITFGEGMPHIWPLLPVMKEARTALDLIVATIKKVQKKKV